MIQTSGSEVAPQGLIEAENAVYGKIQAQPPDAEMLQYLHIFRIAKHAEF